MLPLILTCTVGGALLLRYLSRDLQCNRTKTILPSNERVLILGASSGVGRSLAFLYAKRGAKVCVVGRRIDMVDAVVDECKSLSPNPQYIFGFEADFSSPEEMVNVRKRIIQEWSGLDTLQIIAGVSALRPIMALAGVANPKEEDANIEAINSAVATTSLAMASNFQGPLVSALTFIPLLTQTSSYPSILLLSTVAAVIAAPTRGLYAASKASALLLFQSLAIENPQIAFSNILPATIEGDFRASAVDKGPVVEQDPNKVGLKRTAVAKCCMDTTDSTKMGKTRNRIIPTFYWWGHIMYWIWPSFVEKKARKKYNF